VVSAKTVNCFKTRLDRFWLNQDIIYNFRSEIHGTGSRSEITAGIVVVLLSRAKRLSPAPVFILRLRLRHVVSVTGRSCHMYKLEQYDF